MWTKMTRRTWTCATCRIEHTCTLFWVSSFDHSSHSTWLKPLALVSSFHLHAIHVQCSLSCSSSFSPSSPFFYTSSSCLSSWWRTVTPWQPITCAIPPTGLSSPWTTPPTSQKQNLNGEYSLVQQQPYQYMGEDSEKKMEQLNFTKLNSIFEIIIHKYKFGLMIVGKFVWLQEEVRNENISIALIIREQFFTSVFFKDILEAISLIQRYKTIW